MADLNSLRSSLRYWNNQLNTLNTKLKKLKKRRRDVESVKDVLRTTANNNSSDVNSKLRSAGQKLDYAIEYDFRESQLDCILLGYGKNEQGVDGDSSLGMTNGELRRELNDVNCQINETESAISRAQGKIRELKAAIAAEERRQREEILRR